MAEITVFPARQVRTMDESQPVAEAVAVRDGHIVEVGSLASMKPWLDRYDHEVDDSFAGNVIMPGFIDPHLHPSMAASCCRWSSPPSSSGTCRGPGSEPFGAKRSFSTVWHHWPPPTLKGNLFLCGAITRYGTARSTGTRSTPSRPGSLSSSGIAAITRWSSTMPASSGWISIVDAASRHPQIDLDRGAFFENGLGVAYRQFNQHLLDGERFRTGLDRMRQVIHHGGQTTIGDAAMGMYGFEQEWGHLEAVMEQPDTPFRILLMPFVSGAGDSVDGTELVERLMAYRELNTRRLFFTDHVKMLADGGFFAELMMLDQPGFLDGHIGEWLTPPEVFERVAGELWNADLKIHVHVTGDLGVELAISTLEKLQRERPRFDHRFTFEHFGISTPEQVARMAAQGALASVNVYYVYELARAFADHTLGYERASQMSRVGSLERAGVPFAVHSDFTMAPAQPLNNAWIAANRICESGEVMAASERASLDAAIRAITTNAALVLGLEDQIGSLRAGKKADFVVLDADPYEVGIDGLRDIGVLGTVFEGESFVRA